MRKPLRFCWLLMALASLTAAQSPDLRYRFDQQDGRNSGSLVGHDAAIKHLRIVADVGANGTDALVGSIFGGARAATDYALSSLTPPWTISLFADLTETSGEAMVLLGSTTNNGLSIRKTAAGDIELDSSNLASPSTVFSANVADDEALVLAWVYDGTTLSAHGYGANSGLLGSSSGMAVSNPLASSGNFVIGSSGSASPPLQPGGCIDEVRVYTAALPPGTLGALSNALLTPEWQKNSPGATFAGGTVAQPDPPPASCNRYNLVGAIPGDMTNVRFQSNLAMPWDVGIGFVPGRSRSQGGIVNPGGIDHLDPTDPSLVYLFGQAYVVPFPGDFDLPVSFPSPIGISAQMFVASPIMGQLVHSGFLRLEFTSFAQLPGPTGDDQTLQVFMADLAVPAITFAGTTYTSFFVNANGSVSFGSGDPDFSPSVTELAQDPPRLAGLWTDLAPHVAGAIRISSDDGTIAVGYQDVFDNGPGVGLHSVNLVFYTTIGACAIQDYTPDPALGLDSIVGLSPGAPATDPGPQSFSTLGALGGTFQFNAATDMIYEFATSSPVPAGFLSAHFPFSDGSFWVVY